MATIGCKVYLGVPDTTNLLGNPGFETAGAGGDDVFGSWTEWQPLPGMGLVVDETVQVHAGAHAAKLIYNSGGSGQVYQTLGVTPGRRITGSFWARGDGSVAGRYSVYDVSNNAYIIPITSTAVFATTYAEINLSFVIPVGCTSIVFSFLGPDASGAGYFDTVSLIDVDDLTWTENQDVLAAPPPTWERGLPGEGVQDLVATPGRLTFTLDNGKNNLAGLPGLYSPAHANHLSGFELGMPVKVELDRSFFLPSPPSITPTLGAELLTNGGFETAGGGGADVWANWTEGVADGAIADETVLVHSGAHAAKLTSGPSSNTQINTSPYLTVVPRRIYRYSFWTRGDGTNAGNYGIYDRSNLAYIVPVATTGVPGTSYAQVSGTFVAPAGCVLAQVYLWATPVNGGIAYFDDVSLKALNLASMLGSVQDMGGASVIQQVKLTIPASYIAGLVFGIDSEAAPQNLIRVIYDRVTAKVHITELVAGVWAELQATAVSYVADAPLKAQKLNNQITAWYNGTLVGSANVPCTANPYTKYSLMATDVSVTFANFAIDGLDSWVEFVGEVTSIQLASGLFDQPVVSVEAEDWLKWLPLQQLGVLPLATNQRFDQGITTALAQFAKQPVATDFDQGVETFLTNFDTDYHDMTMAWFFQKMARNEFGRIYLSGAGTLVLENRDARPLNQVSAFTLNGTMSALAPSYEADDVANAVFCRVYPRKVDTVAVRLWDLAGAPAIGPGQTLVMVCPFSDPVGGSPISAMSVVDPVTVVEFGSVGDFVANDLAAYLTQANIVGANALEAHLTDTHPNKTGYLNDFEVFGLGIYHYSAIDMEARDDVSVETFGERRLTVDLDQISDPNKGLNFAYYILSRISDEHARVGWVTFNANQSDALAAAAVAAEVSTRFTMIESVTGLNQDFYVNRLRFSYDYGQLWVGLLAVPAAIDDQVAIWNAGHWDDADDGRAGL